MLYTEPKMNCLKCGKKSYISICVGCLKTDLDIDKKSCNILMQKEKLIINDIPKLKIKKGFKTPIEAKWQDAKNTNLTECKDYDVGYICNKQSGIICVDLDFYTKQGKDPYDPINNPNHKLFIDTFGNDFINRFNTYSQKTPNGGFHFIFKHHKDIIQTSNHKFKIDTRGGSTNGYVKKYQCINDTDIKQIPNDLLDFLKTNVFNKEVAKISKKVNKNLSNSNLIYQEKYSYDVPTHKAEEIIKALPKAFFTDMSKWLCFTAAMKDINKKTLWDKYSKKYGGKTYNKENNFKTWDRMDYPFKFEYILKVIKKTQDIKYYRFLDVPKNKFKGFKHINIDKLSKQLTLNDGKSYCIKSDTGTGKTTLFKQHIKKTQDKFISITSRRTLAKEQYEDFLGICQDHISYYEYDTFNPQNQGLTICIDSILKIKHWDFSNHIIFLDEFNSIIEYILDTDTMAKIRDEVFDILLNTILLNCKAIICVDADISDLSIQYLKEIERIKGIKLNYIQNDYIHNKGTLSSEIHEHEDFIEMISKEEMWLLPTDSKKQAKNLWVQLTNIDKEYHPEREPIILIIAEDTQKLDETIRLSQHKRIIFSPKIVYGLDSNGYGKNQLSRPVYSYYEMKTISPSAMLQQINRERKISHHYYFLYSKNVSKDTIISEDEFKIYVEEENKLALKIFQLQEYHNNMLFCSLLYYYEYKKNCFRSNPAYHFKKLLKQRGFKLTNEELITGNRDTQLRAIKKENAEIYDKEHYDMQTLLLSDVNRKLLKIYDTTQICKYRELIVDNSKTTQHINIKHLFLLDDDKIKHKLEASNDFGIKKIKSSNNKILFVKKVLSMFGLNKNLEKVSTDITNNFSGLVKEYKTIFRDRSNLEIKLNTDYERVKFVASKLYSKLNIPMKNTDKKIDGIKLKEYKINEDDMKLHRHLFEYSTREYIQKDINYIQTIDENIQQLKTDLHIQLLAQ